MSMNDAIVKQLRAPFLFEEVEAKVQVTSGDKSKGLVVFYLDARSVQERLDQVLGPFGWRNEYIMWHEKSQICGLSIFNSERGEWVIKYDGAENSDIEAVKGGLTDAFKRSAVLWGLGRYLYQLDGIWCEVEQRGKGSYIKDNQQGKLKAAYDAAVRKIFGSAAQIQQQPTTPPAQQPPVQQPSTPSPVPEQAQALNDGTYEVRSTKPSGGGSSLLELVSGDGEVMSAYVKNTGNPIGAGTRLRDIQLVKRKSSYGQYNLLVAFNQAA